MTAMGTIARVFSLKILLKSSTKMNYVRVEPGLGRACSPGLKNVFLRARRSTSCCAFLRASRTEEVFLLLDGLLIHALRHALQARLTVALLKFLRPIGIRRVKPRRFA
jgi:hypothetical protein